MVAERLRDATVEGRLLTEELDARLEVALSAQTYGELAPLLADLPGSKPVRLRDAREQLHAWTLLVLAVIVATLAAIVWHRW